MAVKLQEFQDRTCSCGHAVSRHWSESEDAYFNGLFNPDLAGLVKTYTWINCVGDIDPQGEPCSSIRHEWGSE